MAGEDEGRATLARSNHRSTSKMVRMNDIESIATSEALMGYGQYVVPARSQTIHKNCFWSERVFRTVLLRFSEDASDDADSHSLAMMSLSQPCNTEVDVDWPQKKHRYLRHDSQAARNRKKHPHPYEIPCYCLKRSRRSET